MGETKLISLRLPIDLLAEVDLEAETDHRSRSQVIELRLREAYPRSSTVRPKNLPAKAMGAEPTENGRRQKEKHGENHQSKRDMESGDPGSGEGSRAIKRVKQSESGGRDKEASPSVDPKAVAISAVAAIGEQVVTAAEVERPTPPPCDRCDSPRTLDYGTNWHCAKCGRNQAK